MGPGFFLFGRIIPLFLTGWAAPQELLFFMPSAHRPKISALRGPSSVLVLLILVVICGCDSQASSDDPPSILETRWVFEAWTKADEVIDVDRKFNINVYIRADSTFFLTSGTCRRGGPIKMLTEDTYSVSIIDGPDVMCSTSDTENQHMAAMFNAQYVYFDRNKMHIVVHFATKMGLEEWTFSYRPAT